MAIAAFEGELKWLLVISYLLFQDLRTGTICRVLMAHLTPTDSVKIDPLRNITSGRIGIM